MPDSVVRCPDTAKAEKSRLDSESMIAECRKARRMVQDTCYYFAIAAKRAAWSQNMMMESLGFTDSALAAVYDGWRAKGFSSPAVQAMVVNVRALFFDDGKGAFAETSCVDLRFNGNRMPSKWEVVFIFEDGRTKRCFGLCVILSTPFEELLAWNGCARMAFSKFCIVYGASMLDMYGAEIYFMKFRERVAEFAANSFLPPDKWNLNSKSVWNGINDQYASQNFDVGCEVLREHDFITHEGDTILEYGEGVGRQQPDVGGSWQWQITQGR